MKIHTLLSVPFTVILAAGFVGCSKSEPVATGEPAPAAKVEVGAMPTKAEVKMSEPVAKAVEVAQTVAKAAGYELKIPDFKTASVADLSGVAIQSLSGLQDVAKASPAAVEQIGSVKSSLSAGDAMGALKSLSGLGDAVKSIPGATALLDTSKQLVSAWALKQGFDVSKISGVLGALQSGDVGQIAAQALPLLQKGQVSGEQSDLLQGVLNTFGIDSGSAAGAVNAVKGLFGK